MIALDIDANSVVTMQIAETLKSRNLKAVAVALVVEPLEDDGTTHKVLSGETLSDIAARFKTTAKKLAAINNIKNPDVIRVGQILKIK